jgi:hypothetical protein
MAYGASAQCEETNMTARSFHLPTLFMLACSLSACASINSPVDGVVIDATTSKPIPGAFVIAQWIRHGSGAGVDSRITCPHVEVVQADSNGRFQIPEANLTPLGSVERDVYAYGAGYEWTYNEAGGDKTLLMRPFKGTVSQRLESLLNMARLECGDIAHYRRVVLPFYKALYQEASRLTPEGANHKVAQSLRYTADKLELGYEAAVERLQKGEYGK